MSKWGFLGGFVSVEMDFPALVGSCELKDGFAYKIQRIKKLVYCTWVPTPLPVFQASLSPVNDATWSFLVMRHAMYDLLLCPCNLLDSVYDDQLLSPHVSSPMCASLV